MIRPLFAVLFLAAALLAWGWVFVQQRRNAPLQRHIEAADAATRAGNAQQAEQEWRAAVRLAPNNSDLWQQLGEVCFVQQKWAEAADAFLHLQRLKPETPHVYERLAASTLRMGDEVAALKYAQEELKRDPNNITALGLSAGLYSDMGERQKQIEHLRRIVSVRPDDLEFLLPLAEALTDEKQYTEARPYLEHALQLAPDNAAARTLRGIVWFNDPSPGSAFQAEADLKRALEHNPSSPSAHFFLGKLYRRQGKLAPALPHLEKSAELRANRADVHYELAGLYDQLGRPQDAARERKQFEALSEKALHISDLEMRCSGNPTDFAAHRERGLLALEDGDLRRASHYLRRAQELRPDDDAIRAALQQLTARMRGSAQ